MRYVLDETSGRLVRKLDTDKHRLTQIKAKNSENQCLSVSGYLLVK